MISLLLSAVLSADVSLYAPTPIEAVEAMLQIAEVKEDDVLYDLGCGDGRILVYASKSFGCRSVGIEIDSDCIGMSRRNTKRNGVDHLARVYEGDVLKKDIRPATVVTCYLMSDLLRQLKPKFDKLKKGTRIVCFDKAIPGVKPNNTVEMKLLTGMSAKIYLYRTPLVACSGST